MLSPVSGNSFFIHDVYIQSCATTAGPLEHQGPLGAYFDQVYKDYHIGYKSYEQAEIAMLQDAIYLALKKSKTKKEEIDFYYGGDLNNQLASTYYLAPFLKRPVIGIYGACSTIALALIQATLMIESQMIHQAMSFTSSHNATAERQFRYPIEYGIQRKETMTYTATGACAIHLGNKKSKIRIAAVTLGKVVDYMQNDPNDMPTAMAPAALDTYKQHMKDLNRKGTDYDLILTGDLSHHGKKIFEAMLQQENLHYKNYDDCGCMLYQDLDEVKQGGSGPVCSGLVTFGYIYQKMLEKVYKRVLVLPTGALLNPVMVNQKLTIPCVCHGFVLEVVE